MESFFNSSCVTIYFCKQHFLKGGRRLTFTISGWSYETNLPLFNGLTSFERFWMQFSILAKQHEWNNEVKVDNFCLSLRVTALEYFAHLPAECRLNILSIYTAFKNCFGNLTTTEMYRTKLQNLVKYMKRQ